MDFSLMPLAVAHRADTPVAIFRTPEDGQLAQTLACTGAGSQHVASRLQNRRLGCYAAVLVESGEGSLESETAGSLPITAPALFFLFPGERHSYGPQAGTRWREQWLLFEGSMGAALHAAGILDATRPLVQLRDVAGISALFARIRSELVETRPLYPLAAAAKLLELLVTVHRAKRAATTRDTASAETIADAIRADAFGPIDFAALAVRFGISQATLRRRTNAAFGLSPKALQLRVRLDRAKELLATEDLAVEAIAAAVGFDDPYYFSRLFRQREGLSPSRFRAENHRRQA